MSEKSSQPAKLHPLSPEGKPLSTDKNLEELLQKMGSEYHYDLIAKELKITHI